MAKDPKVRIREMEELGKMHPHYRDYIKDIPGFEKAFEANDVEECFNCLGQYLSEQREEPEVRDELLNRIYNLDLELKLKGNKNA